MTAEEFRRIIEILGQDKTEVSRIFGVTYRQVRRWARDGVTGPSAILIRFWFDGKITTKQIERRRD